jgi:DNA-binding NarL/FixJ family response regulator
MSDRIAVHVRASDPILEAGVAAELRGREGIQLVACPQNGEAAVVLLVADTVDDEALCLIARLHAAGAARVVLVVARVDDEQLLALVEAGVHGILRRGEASGDAIAAAVRAAADGDGSIPPDLLGRLIEHVQRHELTGREAEASGLTEREIEVLRMVADGMDTEEIAERLSYSERTIKNVIHDVTSRLHLRNRSHAVAYAMREGLI